jgi:hypothetical protein
MAAASITKETEAIAVVVSESSIVRIFERGELVSEIIPELWMLHCFSPHITQPFTEQTKDHLTILSKPK